MTRNTLIAMYERAETAEQVARELTGYGIQDSQLSIISRGNEDRIEHHVKDESRAGPFASMFRNLFGGSGGGKKDLADSLTRTGLERERANQYANGVRQGQTLLIAEVDDNMVDRAAAIMHQFEKTGGAKGKKTEGKRSESRIEGGTERTIPEVEENVEVGKRSVARGGAHIKSRVVETPVEKDVTLREERVRVEREDVNRPADAETLNKAFKEEDIDVVERGEEVEVRKEARVTGQVKVKKEQTQRTEHISEVERHNVVDIEELPAKELSRYEPKLKKHFEKNYSGEKWNQYRPAYELGVRYGRHPESRAAGYDRLEGDLQKRWEARSSGIDWSVAGPAVRYGYDQGRTEKV